MVEHYEGDNFAWVDYSATVQPCIQSFSSDLYLYDKEFNVMIFPAPAKHSVLKIVMPWLWEHIQNAIIYMGAFRSYSFPFLFTMCSRHQVTVQLGRDK